MEEEEEEEEEKEEEVHCLSFCTIPLPNVGQGKVRAYVYILLCYSLL